MTPSMNTSGAASNGVTNQGRSLATAPQPTVPTPLLRWVRESQARQYLGNVSRRTWKRWVLDGTVKGFAFGKTVLYDLAALDRQVRKGRVEA